MLRKKFLIGLFSLFLCIFAFQNVHSLSIVLDPGHGGTAFGCVRIYDGKEILEKEINYNIAVYVKEKLETEYVDSDDKPVKVYLTRTAEENPSLESRVGLGVQKKALAVISLHNNASVDNNKRGCMALVTSSNFNNLYETEKDLGECFMREFEKIGLPRAKYFSASTDVSLHNGFLRRLSDDDTTYSNGDTTDWYDIVKYGVLKNIPTILVEHAYLSNEDDYKNFLSTDDQLRRLADADVRAIVNFFGLRNVNSKDSNAKV